MLVCKQNAIKWYIQQRDLTNLFCRQLANVLSLGLPLRMWEMCTFFNELRSVLTLRKILVIASFIYFYYFFKIRIRADLLLWTLEINALTIHSLPSFQFSFHAIYHVKIWEVGFIVYPIMLMSVGSSLAWVSSGILRESLAMLLYAFRRLAEQGALIMINNAAIFPIRTFYLFLTSALWDGLGVIVNILRAA